MLRPLLAALHFVKLFNPTVSCSERQPSAINPKLVVVRSKFQSAHWTEVVVSHVSSVLCFGNGKHSTSCICISRLFHIGDRQIGF